MNKTLKAAVFASITAVALAAALPVGAQASPVGSCTLVEEVSIDGVRVLENSVISSGSHSIAQLDAGEDPDFPASTNGTLNDNIEGGAGISVPTTDWGSICLVNTVNNIVNWIFFILLTVAFFLIVVAAFIWTTSAGDATKQQNARNMIIAAMVGIVIALFAQLIPAVVLGIVT